MSFQHREDLDLVPTFVSDPSSKPQLIALSHCQEIRPQLQVSHYPVNRHFPQQLHPGVLAFDTPNLDHAVYSCRGKYVGLLDVIKSTDPTSRMRFVELKDWLSLFVIPEIY